MQWLNNLRQKLGEYILNQELLKFNRQSVFKGFSNAATVGILFNATDKDDFELVKKYVGYLRSEQKKVKAIGYLENTYTADLVYSKLEYDFFTPKELNLYLKPKINFADNFIKEEFDILIDMNIKNCFPLHYISALSKAKFKIGKFNNDNALYDFMIEMTEEKNLKYYLKNIDHYLLQIHSKNSKF